MMAISSLPDQFSERGDWLIQAIDPRARLARLVRMDGDAYRDASFLDDRMLGEATVSRLCSLDEVVASVAGMECQPAGWIFHIGHVGSTLVSRLLGELDGVLALREPRSLRDLAVAGDDERPALAVALRNSMARGMVQGQAAVVKATSFVSEYARLLVAPGAPVLLMFASPRRYIEGILAGENSVSELRALAGERVRRLGARGIEVAGLRASDAHLATAAWLCEMTAIEGAAETMSDEQVMWADFDRMLDDMGEALGRVAAHFGIIADRGAIDAIVAGPLMRRYSKAQEYDYSPALRTELLAEAGRKNRVEIDAALAELEAVAAQYPLAARAIDRARGEC
jgi:hypothetical protein